MKRNDSLNRLTNTAKLLMAFSVISAVLVGAGTASATTYYWDCNDGTTGFGTAKGTWSAATTPTTTYGWSLDSTGATTISGGTAVTTTIDDTLYFGTDATGKGLATGTNTVSGTVASSNMTFGTQSGDITFQTGTINLAATATINLGGNKILFNQKCSGSGTSLTITGGGTLTVAANNTTWGQGGSAVCNIMGGTTVSCQNGNGGGIGDLGGSTGFTIYLGGTDGSAATLSVVNSFNLPNKIIVVAGSGTKKLGQSGSAGPGFSGQITANDNLTISESAGTGSLTISGASGSTIASGKTVTLSGTAAGGDLTDNTAWGGLGNMAYNGNNITTIHISGAKTYSGVSTLNAMTGGSYIEVKTSSAGPAGAPTSGPFGTGTLTIGGATQLRAGTTADITVGNNITFSANPTFPTVASEKTLIFTGDASLGSATRTITCNVGTTVEGKYVEFAGVISGTNGLTKAGTGMLVLSGTNTYTGTTTVNTGILKLGANNTLTTTNNVVLAGGVLAMGSFTNTVGTLRVTDNATLALGDGTGELHFLNSRDVVWTEGATLTLTGTFGDSSLRFGTSATTAITSTQLDAITYNGNPVFIDNRGYITPWPNGTVIQLQ